MASLKQLEAVKRQRVAKLAREHKIINGVDYKFCNKHHIYFPDEYPWLPATLEYFYHNDKNKTDKLYPYCIECGKDSVRGWREENPEWYKDLNHKTNTNPSDKTREAYRKNGQTRRDNGKYYEWLNDNPEKQATYIKNHRQHDITEDEWRLCKKYFGDTCAYCGLPIEKHIAKRKDKYFIMDLHREHVDDDGYNDLRNCVPACRDCNSAKHDFIMIDWFSKQAFYNKDRYNKIIKWITEDYKQCIKEKPPYKITRKQNEDLKTFHWELWTVDEKRNMLELIDIKNKKKDLQTELI